MESTQIPNNDNLPLVNRKDTAIGTAATFLSAAWIAVLLRLIVRFTHRPKLLWWDDLFVLLACLSATAGSVLTILLAESGMGLHYLTLNEWQIEHYFKYLYSSNTTYASSTTFIKLAILLQYLRMFDYNVRLARRLCIALITAIAAWGTFFFFAALLGCQPIAKNWDINLQGHCVMFGSKDPKYLYPTFAAHTGTNCLMDFLVLLLPIPFLSDLRLNGRIKRGLIGLFTIGGTVCVISTARLIALVISKAGTEPTFDPSYYASQIYILAVLEVNIAIIAASIPIFWPLMAQISLGKILVVQEIQVHSTKRDSHVHPGGGHQRMRTNDSEAGIELGRRISQESGKMLARADSNDSGKEDHYHDRYMAGWVMPDFDKSAPGHTTTTVERADVLPDGYVRKGIRYDQK